MREARELELGTWLRIASLRRYNDVVSTILSAAQI